MIDYNITPEPELDVGISTNEITFGIAPAGATGLSAYEIWLKHGNQGTEQEFLESLQAVDGMSAYEVWLDQGNEGTEEDFLIKLQANLVPYVHDQIASSKRWMSRTHHA